MRSRAWPAAASALASMSAISRTIRPVCNANAVQEPTNPPPPMMLTFILLSRLSKRRNDAIGDRLNERLLIADGRRLAIVCRGSDARLLRHLRSHRRRRLEGLPLDPGILPTMAEHVVCADVAVFHLWLEPRIGESPFLFQVEQLAGLLLSEVIDLS